MMSGLKTINRLPDVYGKKSRPPPPPKGVTPGFLPSPSPEHQKELMNEDHPPEPPDGDIKTILERRYNDTELIKVMKSNDEECAAQQKQNKLHNIFKWKDRLLGYADTSVIANSPYKRVIAVGDIHGDYSKLIKVLRHAKVLHPDYEIWYANDTALVQTGDIFDRGPDSLDIVNRLINISEDAPRYYKNASVQFLLGNHEIFNFRGDYIFTSYEDIYRHRVGLINQREHFLSMNSRQGKFLRSNLNVTTIVNDSLFVHAGILPKYAKMGVDYLNNRARELLTTVPSFEVLQEMNERGETHPLYTDEIFGQDGPLNTRTFVNEDESTLCSKVDETLRLTGAKRMIMGHNV